MVAISCEDCKWNEENGQGYWLRVGAANVKVHACRDHFSKLQEAVRNSGLKSVEEGENQ